MFLYDHVLTYRFIFAPSDTTKFFFINWTNTQQVQLHPSVLSLLTWDSSVLEKQELGLISFSLLSFLKSRMRSNKSCSIYSCPYCCRGNQSPSFISRTSIKINGLPQCTLGLQGLVKDAKQIALQKLCSFTTVSRDSFGNAQDAMCQLKILVKTLIPAEITHTFILSKHKNLKLAEECEGSDDKEVSQMLMMTQTPIVIKR